MAACLLVQPIHPSGIEVLERAGLEVRLAASTDMAVVRQQVQGCVAAITRNAGFSADAIEQGGRLQVIGVHGIGVDPVAVSAATAAGICVVNTPTANVQSVAEHAIALMFALAKRIPQADGATRQGNFDFKYQANLVELGGLTLGLVGFGNIGQATARLGAALGMQVLAFSPTRPDAVFSARGVARAPSLDDVLRRADIQSLHLPLVPSTRGMIGARELSVMKKDAMLINTSRGAVLDERALIDALQRGQIRGAGLDVFASERMEQTYELLHLSNVVLTPHIAGSTEACLARTAQEVAHQVLGVLDGRRPQHLVNPDVWARRRTLRGRGRA